MLRTPVIFAAALTVFACASAPPNVKPEASKPSSAPAVSVVRYTERPLSEYQTLVINEATKLSLACRMFRNLYGRWPNDVEEIKAKTEGINFDAFMGRATVTPLPDDSETISIFDGVNTRAVKAVPIDIGFTDAAREASKAPDYKIKL